MKGLFIYESNIYGVDISRMQEHQSTEIPSNQKEENRDVLSNVIYLISLNWLILITYQPV